ncbi:PRC-barrel domain-containing protein [Deinococcus phoenicis]|uniref:PRC-barrel domain-containing protein n=1 Tax=Deinococcus phoenicis TaxID=1476583 RepID=A0A016QV39_9DEIO|nr:PRC-barrel domain-containing protein [Deinococcus phoenicis]EYB69742.1 PRC-barrel domain-containing protein [Deinococcus phoenicis]
MIKGKELLGRNIVAIDTGERVESVHDLIFDHQANQLLGLLVDEGGWFRAARVVPFEAVRSFGEDAIMVDSAASVTTTREDGRLAEVLDSKTSLIGLTLLTTEGENLGKIADVYFDEQTGQVEGYEATGGLFSDMSSGRTFVPAPEAVQIGEDAAIVPVSVAAAMQEQEPGGLKGAVQSAGQSLSGVYQNAADSVKQGYENIAEATKDRQREYVVGKTAGGDITLEDGTVIVHQGDTITAAQAERAEQAGKLTALATAATGGVLGEAYGNVRDRVQGSVDDLRGATAERQKEYVVGKTAANDVTAEMADGVSEVIVHKGSTITTFQAERAEQAGKLGALVAAATGGAIGDSVQEIRERQGLDPNSLEATIGRRVKTDVRAPGGSLVAAQGQIVTPAIAERARHLNVDQALIAATTGGTAAGGTPGASAALAGGVASVSEGASNLLDRAKAWFSDKRDEAGQALEQRQEEMQEQRIRDALGRPVTRVILAPDDSIILNVGEIITHKAIDAARSGNVLDILLDSVSKETVTIDPLAARPHETGSAALEGQPDLTPEAEQEQPAASRIITDPQAPKTQS